jgi:SAM-dependent methyltransferase
MQYHGGCKNRAQGLPGQATGLANRQGSGGHIDTLTELESWYARENGQYLLASTRRAVDCALDTAFGYHLLQTGCSRGHALFASSPINHRIYAAERPGPGVNLLALAGELPLESDSIDTVIAHHTLDFARNPHQVLREIQRVLTPQGHLLIVGFNPHSLLGVNARMRGLSRKSLWHQHTWVSESRLTDWLRLLGCEVQDRSRIGVAPLLGGGTLRRWLTRLDDWGNRHNLPGGSIYVLHAIKQVSALHRPRRQWQLRRERLISLVPKPAPAPAPTPYRPTRTGVACGQPGDEGAA